MVTKTKLRAEESNKPQTNVTWNDVGETKPRYVVKKTIDLRIYGISINETKLTSELVSFWCSVRISANNTKRSGRKYRRWSPNFVKLTVEIILPITSSSTLIS